MRRKRWIPLKKSALMGIAFATCLSSGIWTYAEEDPADSLLAESVEEPEPAAEETEAPQTESPSPAPSTEEQTEAPAPAPSTEEQTEAPAPAPSTEEQTNELQTEAAEFEFFTDEEVPDTEISDSVMSDPEGDEFSWEEGTSEQITEQIKEESETKTESEEEESAKEKLLPVERADDSSAKIAGTDPEEDPTLHQSIDEDEVAETIEGFSIDSSSYPAADASANTRYIYKYLTEEMGLNHAAACGVLANVQLESGFNQYALGDSGTSYGICQWHNERFNSLISYCNSMGLDYNTLDGQLTYLNYELASAYPNVLSYLLGVPDSGDGAYDAGYYWCVYYEAPSDTYARAAQRGNLAKNEYYPLDLSMPEETEPEETIAEETEPAETAAEETEPEEITTEEAEPEETTAEETEPEETVTEETEPEETAAEETSPAEETNERRITRRIRRRLEKASAQTVEEEENRQAVADLRRLLDEREN